MIRSIIFAFLLSSALTAAAAPKSEIETELELIFRCSWDLKPDIDQRRAMFAGARATFDKVWLSKRIPADVKQSYYGKILAFTQKLTVQGNILSTEKLKAEYAALAQLGNTLLTGKSTLVNESDESYLRSIMREHEPSDNRTVIAPTPGVAQPQFGQFSEMDPVMLAAGTRPDPLEVEKTKMELFRVAQEYGQKIQAAHATRPIKIWFELHALNTIVDALGHTATTKMVTNYMDHFVRQLELAFEDVYPMKEDSFPIRGGINTTTRNMQLNTKGETTSFKFQLDVNAVPSVPGRVDLRSQK